MKSKMKLSGQLRSYLRWPLILSILMLVMNIGMYFVDVMAGMWFTLFFAVYVIAAAVLYYRQRPQVINELITFATEYGQVQKHLIQELALPYAVMDSQGKLLWVNKEFTKITGKDTQYHKCIATIFPAEKSGGDRHRRGLRRKEFPCPCKKRLHRRADPEFGDDQHRYQRLFYSGTVSVR